MKIQFSDHAIVRMAQRGIPVNDIELIMLLGTEVEGGYILLDRDRVAAERQLKRTLETLQRLRGKRIVLEHNKLVTAYRATERKRKSLLRNAEEREL